MKIFLSVALGAFVLAFSLTTLYVLGRWAERCHLVAKTEGYDDPLGAGCAVVVLAIFVLLFCGALGGALLEVLE